MSDAGNAQETAPWYDAYDADTKAHVAAKGWDKLAPDAALTAAVQAHRAAERHIGVPADQIIRLPKDAADPSWQAAYDRLTAMATPAKPEDYNFDGVRFKDGTTLDPDDVAFLRDVAAKNKLTLPQARTMAADFAARAETEAGAASSDNETRRAANQIALRQTWGGEYDQKAFNASRVAEAVGLTEDVLAFMATLEPEKYVRNMNALANLSSQFNEATILRTGGVVRNPAAGLDADGAQKRLSSLLTDPAWGERFMRNDSAANEEYAALRKIIADANVTAQGFRR